MKAPTKFENYKVSIKHFKYKDESDTNFSGKFALEEYFDSILFLLGERGYEIKSSVIIERGEYFEELIRFQRGNNHPEFGSPPISENEHLELNEIRRERKKDFE